MIANVKKPVEVKREPTREEIMQEMIDVLGAELSKERLANIEKTGRIDGLGKELAKVKMDIIKMQGGCE